jgi:xanthine dehydrogenase small subunit
MAPAPTTDRWIERLGQGVAARSHVAPQSFSHVSSSGVSFARPTSFDALFTLLANKPAAVLIAGGTDLMVYANQRYTRYQSLISLSGIHELQRFEWNDAEIVIGAGLPLSHLEHHLDNPAVKEEKRALRELLPLFSSRLIRNRATIGGSLATASPIGDGAPPLLALEAELILKSRTGDRRVPLSEFFTGYRATVLGQGEVIVSIHLPRPLPRIQRFYKVSKRVLDDISTVTAAFGLDLASDGTVKRLTIAYGGVAPTPLRARRLEALAAGKPWDQQTLKQLVEASVTIGTPMKDHRGSSAYRRAMIGKLLERFHAETTEQAEAAQ